ncbi:MAG: VCBS repeat-containing protein [Bacteroidota bacterium]
MLLRNKSIKGGETGFEDVTTQAGLHLNKTRTFPTWFWDYDNDGWLDILVCGYEFEGSLAPYFAAEALNIPADNSGKVFLFRNNHNGTFGRCVAESRSEQSCICHGVQILVTLTTTATWICTWAQATRCTRR